MTYNNSNNNNSSAYYAPALFLLLHACTSLVLFYPGSTHAFVLPSRAKPFLHAASGGAAAANTPPNPDGTTVHHRSERHTLRPSSALSSSSPAAGGQQPAAEEEVWYPSDPAHTTPRLLEALWNLIVLGCEMTRGETRTILFPEMEETLTPDFLERLTGHLDMCKDVCDDFGVNTVLSPHVVKRMGRNYVAGFTVKSYKSESAIGTLPSDGDYKFAYDPLWDDDEDWSHVAASIEEQAAEFDEEVEVEGEGSLPEIVDPIPDDDEELVTITKNWVRKLMSDMGVCPFTTGSDLAGLPIGNIYYTTDRCASVEEMYRSYWAEVVRVETLPEKELSTTLLIAPNFCADNIELFENFSTSLTKPLESLQLEDLLQLVFFHPEWTFRDGGQRSGTDSAANYARRSPWPMINILRTSQVRAAQRGIPTGLVYQQNERTLNSIGTEKLESMLRTRDWEEIEDVKVDRRDMEALRVAQDFQRTGVVKEEDVSFEFDSTPAANRVDQAQIEGGNMVNVVMQALEKRLMGGEDKGVLQLSGAETSAAMMASDFLLDHLDKMYGNPEQEKEDEKMAKSRKFYEDNDFSNSAAAEEEMDVLFTGGGIKMDSEDDDFTGVNTGDFY